MVQNVEDPDSYYIDLVGVGIDENILQIDDSVWEIHPDGTGGTRLDSGTTSIMLTSAVYEPVINNLVATTQGMERNQDVERTTGFGLCFDRPDDSAPNVPEFTLYFGSTKDNVSSHWNLPLENYFVPIPGEDRVFCYVFFYKPDIEFNILGNTMMHSHVFNINPTDGTYAISSLVDCSTVSI